MNEQIVCKTKKELQEQVLEEKLKGTSDIEIGRRYGVTLKFIEKVITHSQGINVSSFKNSKKIKRFYPENFKEETTTVWSFKQRGDWATHTGEYRGNWSPYIPRNVILKYSKPKDLVLDYFCGAGTTAVECKLLGRRCIAIDINDKAIELAKKNIDFQINLEGVPFFNKQRDLEIYEPELKVGDARNLSFLEDNSVDLICAHPPYANIIRYTNSKEGDLSFLEVDEFLLEMCKVAKESFRLLKPGKKCVILIGDTRKNKHVIPLGFKLINVYLEAGFKLRELIIKRQHNCKTTGFWYQNSIKFNFLLLSHEYLPVFEKPVSSNSIESKKQQERDIKRDELLIDLENVEVKEVEKFETTTVWVFPEEKFYGCLSNNVIGRYSLNKDFLVVKFGFGLKNENIPKNFQPQNSQQIGLLFIKSQFKDTLLNEDIEYYLEELKKFVFNKLFYIYNNGFVVVQTRDVRINGYIQPLAVRILNMLQHPNLWLKEIIIASYENKVPTELSADEYLKITHDYLIVYEVVK